MRAVNRGQRAEGRGQRWVFWASAGAIVWTHAGYPAFLWLLSRLKRPDPPPLPSALCSLPSVSLIIAARDEEQVIARKVANAKQLDYPRDKLQLIVCSDGS